MEDANDLAAWRSRPPMFRDDGLPIYPPLVPPEIEWVGSDEDAGHDELGSMLASLQF